MVNKVCLTHCTAPYRILKGLCCCLDIPILAWWTGEMAIIANAAELVRVLPYNKWESHQDEVKEETKRRWGCLHKVSN